MKARFERKICLKRNENNKKIDTDSWFSRENLKRLWIGLNLYTNRYAWGWHMRLNDIFLSASIEINLTHPWLGNVLSSVLRYSFINNGSRYTYPHITLFCNFCNFSIHSSIRLSFHLSIHFFFH